MVVIAEDFLVDMEEVASLPDMDSIEEDQISEEHPEEGILEVLMGLVVALVEDTEGFKLVKADLEAVMVVLEGLVTTVEGLVVLVEGLKALQDLVVVVGGSIALEDQVDLEALVEVLKNQVIAIKGLVRVQMDLAMMVENRDSLEMILLVLVQDSFKTLWIIRL